MAENVVLGVQLMGAEAAIAQLTQVDALLKSIKSNHNVKINVNARSLATAATNAEKLSTNLGNVSTNAQKIGTTGTKSIETSSKAIKGASRNAESFNNGLGNVFVTMLKFRAVSTVINGIGSAIKYSLDEIKNVDTELVNIRKVTKMTDKEIAGLTKNAYSLASQYGRSASEVLEGATVYARAGYTDQIDQLAELTLLLQNVGDLQADEAAKFILATDKAYKLGGSYEKLIQVVDGLDNITNKHATDMQKMTEGMTVAGSVFAESGESLEMYAAMLGTVTANTQRSGAEVGRGLRTILMNLRQIRVAFDENGEPIYAENIASAAKALKDFAGISTMENGQLRKASDVLAELAGVWGDLGENEKAAIAEAVAGKRQANFFMSLMGDWPSVMEMMADYENAAGTAAKENEIYMDSWAAKTEVVKSKWTELLSAMADTRVLKDALDLVARAETAAIDYLDERKQYEEERPERGRQYNAEYQIGETAKRITNAYQQFEIAPNADFLAESLQEAVEAGEAYYQELQQLRQEGKTWNEEEKKYVATFEAVQNGLEQSQNGYELYGYAVAASLLATGESAEDSAEKANTKVQELAQSIDELHDKDVTISVNFTVNGSSASGSSFANLGGFDGRGGKFASGTSSAPGGPALVNENGPEMISAGGLAWIAGGGKPTVTMLPKGATVLTASQTRQATHGKSISGIPSFEKGTGRIDSNYIKRCPNCNTMNEPGAHVCRSCGYNFLTGKVPEKRSFESLRSSGSASSSVSTSIDYRPLTGAALSGQTFIGNTGSYYKTRICPVCGTVNPSGAQRCVACGYNFASGGAASTADGGSGDSGGGGYYGGYSGPAAPNFTELENDLTALLKNLNAQAELAENEEDYLKAMMVYGEAQSAIADLLEQYRANGYADDSDEVLRLANLGYDYAAKQLGGYDKLQQNLIDALNALTDSTDKANELQEKRDAVDKAREALSNAEKQRTVRVFNPVTGQWEWIANAAEITKAQENLKNAEEALRKEEISQTIDAIKNAKPGELGGMNLSSSVLDALMNATPEQQSAFLNALGAATGGADWLGSSEAQTAWNQGTSIGTQYNLAGITLTEAQAGGMTIKDLIYYLQSLKVM